MIEEALEQLLQSGDVADRGPAVPLTDYQRDPRYARARRLGYRWKLTGGWLAPRAS